MNDGLDPVRGSGVATAESPGTTAARGKALEHGGKRSLGWKARVRKCGVGVVGMFAIGSCGSDGIALHQRRRAGAVDEGREGSEGDEESQKSSSSEEGDVA